MPFCGPDDHSEHLGIDLSQERWACWRNPQHRGKSPIRLVAALINCTFEQAADLTGKQRYIPSDFGNKVLAALAPATIKKEKERSLTLPKEFKTFRDVPSAQPFLRYLEGRGFGRRFILSKFSQSYGMYYAVRGPYRYRVIFTIEINGKLLCWTGRAINDARLRYKALSDDPEKAQAEGYDPAVARTVDLLLWYDDLVHSDAHTLVLCEGPFDALKVRFLGQGKGVVASCFFTAAPSEAQIALLCGVADRFKRRIILLDQGTLPVALHSRGRMAGIDAEVVVLPIGIKDPGDLTNLGCLNLDRISPRRISSASAGFSVK
jgi:hypothetical protein